MADEEQHIEHPNAQEAKSNGSNKSGGLQNFITEQYEAQQNDGRIAETKEIDDERAAKFLSRALAESQRMNAEVQKSHAKIDALHSQVGARNIAAWQDEHAAEVLLPEQMEAVRTSPFTRRSPSDSA